MNLKQTFWKKSFSRLYFVGLGFGFYALCWIGMKYYLRKVLNAFIIGYKSNFQLNIYRYISILITEDQLSITHFCNSLQVWQVSSLYFEIYFH